MSQILRAAGIGIAIFCLALMLTACGSSTPNKNNVFSSEEAHSNETGLETGELAWHQAAAKSNLNSCKECHGQDLSGGISGVSCSQCHLGGPGSVHPLEWSTQTGTLHAPYVVANGNASCANVSCHGADLSGVANSGVSCKSCHLGGVASVHPTNWGDLTYYYHAVYARANGTSSCANVNCHGAALAGVSGSGPSCTKCHMGGVGSVHPTEWNADITLHKPYVATFGATVCATAVCHGTDLKGVYLSGWNCNVCHTFNF